MMTDTLAVIFFATVALVLVDVRARARDRAMRSLVRAALDHRAAPAVPVPPPDEFPAMPGGLPPKPVTMTRDDDPAHTRATVVAPAPAAPEPAAVVSMVDEHTPTLLSAPSADVLEETRPTFDDVTRALSRAELNEELHKVRSGPPATVLPPPPSPAPAAPPHPPPRRLLPDRRPQ